MNNNANLTILKDNIESNFKSIKKFVGDSKVALMFKANCYGLGMENIFDIVYNAGARIFFVAYLKEALKLKKIIGDKPVSIYILQDLLEDNYKDYLKNDFIPVLNTMANVKLWHEKGENKSCLIHFDSGINRIGLSFKELHKLKEKNILSELNIEYLMSHFAESEVKDSEYTEWQYSNFKKVLELFPKDIKISLSNSSGTLNHEDRFHFDMVRVGAALYGINPTPHTTNPVKPSFNLDARIIQIKEVKVGDKVGYNGGHEVLEDGYIALLGIGHADSISRSFGNKGHVFFKGNKLPIIGNISMDLTAINITSISDEIKEGDYVEIIGDHQTVDEFSSYGPSISYEFLTLLGQRNNVNIK